MAGLAGREHCMGSPASNGATCEHCMGSPASNGGQQRRWRGEHQGRKESCRPPNQDWVTPRERKAVIDPSPPVGVPPVLALPPLLLSLFPLPLLSAVPTPFVPLFSLLRGGPFPISHWRTRLRPRGVKESGMKVLELPKRSPALNPMDFRICHGRDTPQRAGVR